LYLYRHLLVSLVVAFLCMHNLCNHKLISRYSRCKMTQPTKWLQFFGGLNSGTKLLRRGIRRGNRESCLLCSPIRKFASRPLSYRSCLRVDKTEGFKLPILVASCCKYSNESFDFGIQQWYVGSTLARRLCSGSSEMLLRSHASPTSEVQQRR
jgi:hypothetical protein